MYTYVIAYEPVTIASVEYPKWNIYYYENGVEILKEFHSTDGINGTIRDFAKIKQARKYNASHSIASSDSDCLLEMNVANGNILTILTHADASISIGTKIDIVQLGVGETSIEAAPGVTIFSAENKRALRTQYSVAHLIKKSTNEWYLYGDLKDATPYLTLEFTDITGILGISDTSDVAEWNTAFDTATYADTPFTSVEVDGNTVRLFGATNLELKAYLFDSISNLISLASIGIVTSVGPFAFSYNGALESVSLKDANTISNNSFANCPNLILVNLPNAVSIGDDAFAYNSNLANVVLPSTETIGSTAFRECTNLTSIELVSCITIGDSAFMGTGLSFVNLPNVITVGVGSFSNCASLQSCTLPLAENIGSQAFEACVSLITVNIPSCISLGASTSNDAVFATTASIENITVPVALETIDGGNPDGDLLDALSYNTVLSTNGITYV